MKKIIPPKLKATIALEAVKGVKTINQIGSEYEAHPVQVGIWKKQLVEYWTARHRARLVEKKIAP
ncbi:MAG: transposase IS3/IS911 family protein [Parcubacteria group bacterium Greene0714_4]|nr:MAG: transposase IS3/IS911 family protein [Parcubacteria group bacterium Greene0714_4]